MAGDAKHSPEPWVGYEDCGHHRIDSAATEDHGALYIADVFDAKPEDFRRLMACVRACQGVPTEALERGVVAEFLTHVEAMLLLLDDGAAPTETKRVARQMLRELGRRARGRALGKDAP